MTFIDELLDLSTATRRVARTIADPSITPRLAEIASELDGMARAEGQISLPPCAAAAV